MKRMFEYTVLFIYGGVIYYFMELLYRGYSHLTMILVGGLCFICIGRLNEIYANQLLVVEEMAIASAVVTAIEFLAGVILNIWLKLDIWDYSNLSFNLLGQISLQTSMLWLLLAFPAIYLDGYLRYWMFDGKRPKYKFNR